MTTQTDHWKRKHEAEYKHTGWIDKPSLFAETAIQYFPKTGRILELGAGQGQDSRFFAEHGYEVVSTDLEDSALELNRSKLSPSLAQQVTIQKIDINAALPFADESFDVVYAHLSLHYFTDADTKQIFAQVSRVLKPGGILAFLPTPRATRTMAKGR